MSAFVVFALDIGERATGYVIGSAGERPAPRLYFPRKDGESLEDGAVNLARWVRDRIEKTPPSLIVLEHYLPSAAATAISGALAREGQIALHFSVRAVAACYRIPVRAPFPSTVRTHFCGQPSAVARRRRGEPPRSKREIAEGREATKLMVIRRAQKLGYMPATCNDDNLADAAALWDYAAATFGNRLALQEGLLV